MQGETDSEPPQLVDVGAMLPTLAHAAADAGGAVAYEGAAHLGIACRPVALRRAVTNLIGNAVSYAGGATIKLSPSPAALRITVEDDGPGIPEAGLERVFEPFHRLDASRTRATGGVGPGLTIARQSVAEQGGTFALANRPGGGLLASIDLPPARPTQPERGQANHRIEHVRQFSQTNVP